jgi:hypothetical protein
VPPRARTLIASGDVAQAVGLQAVHWRPSSDMYVPCLPSYNIRLLLVHQYVNAHQLEHHSLLRLHVLRIVLHFPAFYSVYVVCDIAVFTPAHTRTHTHTHREREREREREEVAYIHTHTHRQTSEISRGTSDFGVLA